MPIKSTEDKSNKVAEPTKKPQTTSQSYAIRQFGKNLEMLQKAQLLDEEDLINLKKVHTKLITKYLGYDINQHTN